MKSDFKIEDLVSTIHDFLERIIRGFGFGDYGMIYLKLIIMLLILLLIVFITHFIAKEIISRLFKHFISKTSTHFDDYLLAHRLPDFLSRLVPLSITVKLIPVVLSDFSAFIPAINTLLDIYSIFLGIQIIRSILRSLRDYLKTKDSFKDKPIDSYIQVMVIGLYFIAGILIFTTLTGKSIVAFFTTLGAASAILLLIFKDTILGFVASIQVTVNDMVRIGDWITMNKYGADGDVIEITLTTVKVQNFDKTITTIPTYNLISDSFINWRGMQRSGGRRIKRAINIKIASIKFLSEEEIEKLKKIKLIEKYLNEKTMEIAEHNIKIQGAKDMLVNGRNLTNIGVFRIYIEEYLKSNKNLNSDFTMMTRQLAPENDGLPLEIYAFTNVVIWKNYEAIMADIFDHLLATVSYFDLEVFESPSSGDFKSLISFSKG